MVPLSIFLDKKVKNWDGYDCLGSQLLVDPKAEENALAGSEHHFRHKAAIYCTERIAEKVDNETMQPLKFQF